jgi:hypothetical protein
MRDTLRPDAELRVFSGVLKRMLLFVAEMRRRELVWRMGWRLRQ